MDGLIQAIELWVHDIGPWGYPIAILLMAAIAVLPIPAEIPAAMNGMLFGPVAGIAITWVGALLGAQLSFELARRFGRPLVRRIIPTKAVDRVDGAVRLAAWPGLLVARLIPAVAFTVLNWALGLTACQRRTFLWTTAIGILPGTIVFVLTGEGLARLYMRRPLLAVLVSALALLTVGYVAWRRRRDEPDAVPAERGGPTAAGKGP